LSKEPKPVPGGSDEAIPSYILGLAGEYYVSAELSRWGYQASITYGAAKRVDIQVVNPRNRRLLWVETKSTQNYRKAGVRAGREIIEHAQWPIKPRGGNDAEEEPGEDFYVFVLIIPKSTIPPRFFICSREETLNAYQQGLEEYNERRHQAGKPAYDKVGVPNVALRHIVEFENKWGKIIEALGGEN